jgi:DNA-binding NarL/FixJ family response regulator
VTRRKLTVVIVDDSSSVRAVLRRFLAQASDIQVIGEAPTAKPPSTPSSACGPTSCYSTS